MPSEPEKIQFVADRGDEKLRLDQAIVRHLRDVASLSRNRVQTWIEEERVTVDGLAARRSSSKVPERAVVEISLPPDVRRRQPPAPEPRVLAVVYEDDALLVIDKPAGLVVHPSYKQASGTLLNAVLAHRSEHPISPGIITRLDKQTSGLVIVAIGAGVHRQVQRDAESGLVKKEYLALVEGTPSRQNGVISLSLGRDTTDRRRVIPSETGAPARTRFEVVAAAHGRALLRCELLTGRTHQIRSHLAAHGWPLVGDAMYGSRDAELGDRQALHAWRVGLPHPLTREPLTLIAPVPPDLLRAGPELFRSLERSGQNLTL